MEKSGLNLDSWAEASAKPDWNSAEDLREPFPVNQSHQDGSATFASYLIRIRVPDDLVSPDYVNLVMNTPFFRKTQVEPHIQQQTGQANVNGTIMRNMLIPVPPFEEQLRIVEKVEELHFICDQIGERLARIDALKVALANHVAIDLAA